MTSESHINDDEKEKDQAVESGEAATQFSNAAPESSDAENKSEESAAEASQPPPAAEPVEAASAFAPPTDAEKVEAAGVGDSDSEAVEEASVVDPEAKEVELEQPAAGQVESSPESSTSDALEAEAAPAGEPAEAKAEETAAEQKDEPAEKEGPEEPASEFEELDPEREKLPWYVVHTYSGYEIRAKKSLQERVKMLGLTELFGNVIVPQETVVEVVRGQKKTSKKKFYPGYMLVQMDLNDETWHVVKETPKVTGFVGDTRHPSPITEEEVAALKAQLEGGASQPRLRMSFEEGDSVKVIDGPFADFNGTVDEVKPDKGKLRVLISIFGRNTPVELDFVQVEKV